MIKKQVKDWMNSDVITVSGSSTLPDAYWLMLDNDVRRLPVVEDGVLVGIVTLEDLRRMDPIEAAGFDIIRISNMLAHLPIRQLMTKNPKTIAPAESLVKAAQLMLRNKISTLPVLDGDELVGIITESDIFRAFVESEEQKEQVGRAA